MNLPQEFSPDFLKQLELLKIRTRRSFLGTRQGGHISPKRGHGIEFADYRQYELGDNPRHIDWAVYARSERLYVKKYQEEQDLKVHIILDTSASMFTPVEDGKWSMARNLALALGYVALMEQDSVLLLAPFRLVSPAYFGGRAFSQMARDLLQVETAAERSFSAGVKQIVGRIKFPGAAIVISDFLMPMAEVRETFSWLRARNMDITAIQVLGAHDYNPLDANAGARVIDSESSLSVQVTFDERTAEEYRALLSEHQMALREFLNSSRIAYVAVDAGEALEQVVIENIAATGLLQ